MNKAKCWLVLVFICFLAIASYCDTTNAQNTAVQPRNALILWYQKPAKEWVEALPVGNGRLGAMVFGRIPDERIQLNEDSLWVGYRRDRNNPKAPDGLVKVRKLIFEGKNIEAAEAARDTMMGVPLRIGSYQTLGDLHITSSLANDTNVNNYRRCLDLQSGIATTTWQIDGVTFNRDVFVSEPDQVCVVRLTADKSSAINTKISLSRPADARCITDDVDSDSIRLVGQIHCIHHKTGQNVGMKFECRLKAIVKGGKLSNSNGVITIKDADAVTLLLAAATDYRGGNCRQICKQTISKAKRKSFSRLRADHIHEHRRLFDRVSLDLGDSGKAAQLPTDKRLSRVVEGKADPVLVALYFQYGRYLLMGCSRPGSMPANLQGIWNEHLSAPWNSDYHANINIQMNYWPAEVCNLSECHLPLFDWMQTLTEPVPKTPAGTTAAGAGSSITSVTHSVMSIRRTVLSGDCGLWGRCGCVSISTNITCLQTTKTFSQKRGILL